MKKKVGIVCLLVLLLAAAAAAVWALFLRKDLGFRQRMGFAYERAS